MDDDEILPTCKQCNVDNHEVADRNTAETCVCDTYNNYVNVAPNNSKDMICKQCPENSIPKSDRECRCLYDLYVQKTDNVWDGCLKCNENSHGENTLHKCICIDGYIIDKDD